MVYSMIWMIFSALKTTEEVFGSYGVVVAAGSPVGKFPAGFRRSTVFTLYREQFFTATVIMLVQLFLSSSLAYALSHMWFRGRETLFWFVLSTYMLPAAAKYVPSYLIVARMGIMDSLAGIIVSNLANVFPIFLLRQNFLKVPKELIDATRADGASE